MHLFCKYVNLKVIGATKKKLRILSVEYWLFHRDPYVMVYHNPYISGPYNPKYPKQEGLFHCSNDTHLQRGSLRTVSFPLPNSEGVRQLTFEKRRDTSKRISVKKSQKATKIKIRSLFFRDPSSLKTTLEILEKTFKNCQASAAVCVTSSLRFGA